MVKRAEAPEENNERRRTAMFRKSNEHSQPVSDQANVSVSERRPWSMRKSLSRTLSRLSGLGGKGKPDLSNDVIRYQSVSVAFVQDLFRGLSTGEKGRAELFVVSKQIENVNAGETVKVIENLKDGKTAKCRIPYTGIMNIPLKNLKPKQRCDWTIEDVCEYVILPECREKNCFYLDLLDPTYIGKTYQGAFVSQARKSKFADLVGALLDHYKGKDLTKQFVWIDIFCAHQPKLTKKDEGLPEQLKQKQWDQLTYELHDAIQHFDDRLIFFNSWLNPYPLSRAWCVWEIYGTVKCDKTIDLIFAPGATDNFVDTIVDDFDAITQNLADLKLENAECHKKGDLEMIHCAVEKTIGFQHLNAYIAGLLRKWLVKTARQVVEQKRSERSQNRIFGEHEKASTLGTLLSKIARFIEQQVSSIINCRIIYSRF